MGISSQARRRLTQFILLYGAVVLLIGAGVAWSAWAAVGPRMAVLMGLAISGEGVLVVGVAGIAARRAATRRSREAATWEAHWGTSYLDAPPAEHVRPEMQDC